MWDNCLGWVVQTQWKLSNLLTRVYKSMWYHQNSRKRGKKAPGIWLQRVGKPRYNTQTVKTAREMQLVGATRSHFELLRKSSQRKEFHIKKKIITQINFCFSVPKYLNVKWNLFFPFWQLFIRENISLSSSNLLEYIVANLQKLKEAPGVSVFSSQSVIKEKCLRAALSEYRYWTSTQWSLRHALGGGGTAAAASQPRSTPSKTTLWKHDTCDT